jgi:Coenzyme PQQ synthesis protein D (PqqD)
MPSDRAGDPDAILRHSPDAVSNRLGEGGVVVNLRTNRIFELNATGMRAWELMDDGRTRAELERQLEAEFDAAPGRVRTELEQLIAQLAREGLVDANPEG